MTVVTRYTVLLVKKDNKLQTTATFKGRIWRRNNGTDRPTNWNMEQNFLFLNPFIRRWTRLGADHSAIYAADETMTHWSCCEFCRQRLAKSYETSRKPLRINFVQSNISENIHGWAICLSIRWRMIVSQGKTRPIWRAVMWEFPAKRGYVTLTIGLTVWKTGKYLEIFRELTKL